MKEHNGFTQVLVTRFSVRLDGKSVIRDRGTEWLFSELRVKRRLALFSNLTFPSLINSSERPEHYIIVIDNELPTRFRKELELMVEPFPWAVIHVWDPKQDWFSLEWVMNTVNTSSPNILIGQIDDDDALERGANKRIRNAASNHLCSGRKALWMWFGSNNAWEWDLNFDNSQLGYIKPFSGGTSYWQGVGTSILVPKEKKSPTSYVWPHSVLEMTFKPFWIWRRVRFGRVFRLRMGLLKRLWKEGNGRFIPSLMMRGWVCDVGVNDPVEVDMLVSNSGTNLQEARMHFGKNLRRSDNVHIDLQRFGVTEQAVERIRGAFLNSESNNPT